MAPIEIATQFAIEFAVTSAETIEMIICVAKIHHDVFFYQNLMWLDRGRLKCL